MITSLIFSRDILVLEDLKNVLPNHSQIQNLPRGKLVSKGKGWHCPAGKYRSVDLGLTTRQTHFLDLITQYGTSWARLKKEDGRDGKTEFLGDRDQVALKDKARNMKLDFLLYA